jgi:hypothetical protein
MSLRDSFHRTRIDKYRLEKRTFSRQFDKFGIEKLYPSIPGGREFYMPEDLLASKVNAVKRIGDTEMVVHGNGAVTPGEEYYKIEGKVPRLCVYSKNMNMRWDNVEMTCYYNKASSSTNKSAGFVMGARGFHHLGGNFAKIYYLKHHFINKAFYFLKEHEHGGSGHRGYADTYDMCPNSPFNDNTWYGAKFILRTKGISVSLKGYKDETDGEDGGEWKKLFEFTDNGNWNSFAPYLDGPSCMVRTDGVTDFRIKRLSIRTIEPIDPGDHYVCHVSY